MEKGKMRNCKSGIYLAAIDNLPLDVFDKPLDEEQLKLYHSIQKMCKELDEAGVEHYTIDIPSEV